MRQILSSYAEKGVPEDLVAAAKRSEVAQAEFQRNSIPDLANLWSNALAAEGRTSPEEDLDAIRKVTLADVDRVLRQYLLNANTITASLEPVSSGQPVAAKGFGGGEQVTTAPTNPVRSRHGRQAHLRSSKCRKTTSRFQTQSFLTAFDSSYAPDHTSPTVTVLGSVKHNSDLQTPPGDEGLADLLDGLYTYGTQTLDRLAFQQALDDIAADESAGYRFLLNVLKDHFSRGVQLLADNELHPALPAQAFAITRQKTMQFVAGNLHSPGYRTSRALDIALLPAGDPALGEATPATISRLTLDKLKQYHAATIRADLTTIVVIGDVTPEDAKAVIERYFGDWKAVGPKPNTTLPAVPLNKPSAQNVTDAERVQDPVVLAEQLKLNRFDHDYYPLQLGTHVLGGGFYATRLYHGMREFEQSFLKQVARIMLWRLDSAASSDAC